MHNIIDRTGLTNQTCQKNHKSSWYMEPMAMPNSPTYDVLGHKGEPCSMEGWFFGSKQHK